MDTPTISGERQQHSGEVENNEACAGDVHMRGYPTAEAVPIAGIVLEHSRQRQIEAHSKFREFRNV